MHPPLAAESDGKSLLDGGFPLTLEEDTANILADTSAAKHCCCGRRGFFSQQQFHAGAVSLAGAVAGVELLGKSRACTYDCCFPGRAGLRHAVLRYYCIWCWLAFRLN